MFHSNFVHCNLAFHHFLHLDLTFHRHLLPLFTSNGKFELDFGQSTASQTSFTESYW